MNGHAIDEALARYHREHHHYLELADLVGSRCRRLAEQADIPAVVQWRVKSPERVRTKLERLASIGSREANGGALDALGDLAGVRVATWVEAGRAPMVATICDAFSTVQVEVKDRAGSFYRASHCQIRLAAADAPDVPAELIGRACEVQVCSLLAQVWNEIEHGLVYAGEVEPSAEELAALAALGHMTHVGDALLGLLLDARTARGATTRARRTRRHWPLRTIAEARSAPALTPAGPRTTTLAATRHGGEAMNVRELMSEDLVCVAPETDIVTAAVRMAEHGVGALPVCDQERLVGIITDRDVVVRYLARRFVDSRLVVHSMTPNPVVIGPDEPIERAEALMAQHGVRRLPVCDGDRLVGIVSQADLARHASHEDVDPLVETMSGRDVR
jgi:CBS domain-containing protein/ppGpp synthetase/RelA/SpoT-type nucleotidyltranferase